MFRLKRSDAWKTNFFSKPPLCRSITLHFKMKKLLSNSFKKYEGVSIIFKHCWFKTHYQNYSRSIDDEVVDMQYRPLCSPKLKNSFLTRDHDKLTILASCLHLLSFLAPNPPKKWQVIYGWPCFEIIMACYSLLFPTIYLLRHQMHESR